MDFCACGQPIPVCYITEGACEDCCANRWAKHKVAGAFVTYRRLQDEKHAPVVVADPNRFGHKRNALEELLGDTPLPVDPVN